MSSARRRPWLTAGFLALVAAAAVYVVGLLQTLTVATDVEERCTAILGQPYDPSYGVRSWWPISRRCNQAYDMVSAWVTPTVVVLMLVATGCLLGRLLVGRRR